MIDGVEVIPLRLLEDERGWFMPSDPDELEIPWDDPRARHLWSTQSPILSSRDQAAAS